jgi:hypothetical protein
MGHLSVDVIRGPFVSSAVRRRRCTPGDRSCHRASSRRRSALRSFVASRRAAGRMRRIVALSNNLSTSAGASSTSIGVQSTPKGLMARRIRSVSLMRSHRVAVRCSGGARTDTGGVCSVPSDPLTLTSPCGQVCGNGPLPRSRAAASPPLTPLPSSPTRPRFSIFPSFPRTCSTPPGKKVGVSSSTQRIPSKPSMAGSSG